MVCDFFFGDPCALDLTAGLFFGDGCKEFAGRGGVVEPVTLPALTFFPLFNLLLVDPYDINPFLVVWVRLPFVAFPGGLMVSCESAMLVLRSVPRSCSD